jgi:hypothetical protein
MKKLIAALALAATLFVTPAQAQNCGPTEDVKEQLKEKFGETSQAVGTLGTGAILEILTSDNGNFTVLIHLPDGISCLAAEGEDYQQKPAKVPGKDA